MKPVVIILIFVALAGGLYYFLMLPQPKPTSPENPTAATGKTTTPGGLEWYHNLAEAQKANTGKPIFIDVSADWCGPCKRLEAAFHENTQVQEALKPFTLVSIKDNEGKNEEAKQLKVEAYPTLIFFDKTGKEVGRQEGFGKIEQFITLVNDMAAKSK